MHQYEKLDVYSQALDVVELTYRAANGLPQTERYSLTDQMKRASTSIVANIAEGAGRGSNREFSRFIAIARGSAFELEAHVTVSQRLGYVDDDTADAVRDQLRWLRRRLTKLRDYLGTAHEAEGVGTGRDRVR